MASGEFEIWLGKDHHHLQTGDSFQFTEKVHRWRNPGADPAVLIWIISPPIY